MEVEEEVEKEDERGVFGVQHNLSGMYIANLFFFCRDVSVSHSYTSVAKILITVIEYIIRRKGRRPDMILQWMLYG